MAVDANRTVKINFIADSTSVGAVLVDMDGKLRDVKGRFVSAGRQAELFEEQAKQAGQAGAKGFARVAAEAKQAQSAIRGAVKAGQSIVSNLKNVGLIGLGFSQIASFAREAVQALDELATESLEVQQVSRNLAFGIGAATEATEGFVDKMTLARNANKAFALGVASDSQEFASLVGAANKIAQAQGVSAQKLVEQAVVGIGRKSAARLDDLGILLDQAKAERIYAASLGKTAGQLTVLQKEEAFQKAALIEIQKAGDRAASSIDGFAVTVARGKVELQNSKQELLGFDDSLGKVRETMRALTDEELERLRFGEVADEGSAAGKELNAVLAQWDLTLRDVRGAADDLGVSFQDLIKGQKELREVQAVEQTLKGLNAINQSQIAGLEAQADEVEFIAKLGAAEGASQKLTNLRIMEGLELRRDAAQLQAAQTQSAEDNAKVLAITRDIQLAQASAGRRGGGGSGPSSAERLLASGEQRVAQMETMAQLAGVIAGTASQTADAAEFERAAAMERLLLEREALELTKARGKFAQQELANELAANSADQAVLRAETRSAAIEREREELATIVSIETARSASESEASANRLALIGQEESARAVASDRALEAEARRLDLTGRSFEAEQVRASAQFAAASRQFDALGREFEAREILRQQAELELINNPPETQLEIIEQRGALAQLEFEREQDRRSREADSARKRDEQDQALHQAELKRIKERTQKQKAAIAAGSRFLQQGQQFASAVIGVAIKDEEKRAQAELKARGVMAIATGALEVVRGVASAASFNVVEAALHFGAAALAFTQGGIMLAGNLPGRGSASGGAGGAPDAPPVDRETSDAATIVESLPAADGEPERQPRAGQAGGGGNVVNIETITVTGALDDDTLEKIKIGLDDVNNGLEETG